MKKLLLGLGALTAVVAPVATVVACGTNSESYPDAVKPAVQSDSIKTKTFDASEISTIKGLMFGTDKPFTEVAKKYLGTTTGGSFNFNVTPVVKTITTEEKQVGGGVLLSKHTGIELTLKGDHEFVDTNGLEAKAKTASDEEFNKELQSEKTQTALEDTYTDDQKKIAEAAEDAIYKIRVSRPDYDPSFSDDVWTQKLKDFTAKNKLDIAVEQKKLPDSYSDKQKALATTAKTALTDYEDSQTATQIANDALDAAKKVWSNDPKTKVMNLNGNDFSFKDGEKLFLTVSQVRSGSGGMKMCLSVIQLDNNGKQLPYTQPIQLAAGEKVLASEVLQVINGFLSSSKTTTLNIDKNMDGKWLDDNFRGVTLADFTKMGLEVGQKLNVIMGGKKYSLDISYLVQSHLSGIVFQLGMSKQEEWSNEFESDVLSQLVSLFKDNYPDVDAAPLFVSAYARIADEAANVTDFKTEVKNVYARSQGQMNYKVLQTYSPELVPAWSGDKATFRAMLPDAKTPAVTKNLAGIYDKYKKCLEERKTPVELIIVHDGKTEDYTAPLNPKTAVQPEGNWEHYMTLLEKFADRPSIADLIQGI